MTVMAVSSSSGGGGIIIWQWCYLVEEQWWCYLAAECKEHYLKLAYPRARNRVIWAILSEEER
jgi:hypothetical protein